MERRQLGKTDMQVSVLGFGGSEIGYEHASEETVARLLTAHLMPVLTSSIRLSAMKAVKNLSAKRSAIAARTFTFSRNADTRAGSAAKIGRLLLLLESIERSLRRLRTDCLDLIQLHSCSESVLRKGDAITALQTAREKGYSRYIGYSGDSLAAKFAVESGAFDTLQTSINIADQEAARAYSSARARKRDGRHRKAPDRECRLEGSSTSQSIPIITSIGTV